MYIGWSNSQKKRENIVRFVFGLRNFTFANKKGKTHGLC